MTYAIVRHFAAQGLPNKVVRTGLSREEALLHCRDLESSSQTCRGPSGRALTKKKGPWFDGFTREI